MAENNFAPDIQHDYSSGDTAHASLRDYIIQNFDRALDNHWIQVYYQPVVRSMTQTVCGAEALVRWIDPEKGMISPRQFIPVLEETEKICRLDLYVFQQVCRHYREVTEPGEDIIPVSVNLSRKDFTHDRLVEDIDRISREYSVPREFTHVEITESAFVENIDNVNQYIEKFHELGYQVWMDDFGSGYSSLGVLQKYSFDVIKIDMSFLREFNAKSKIIITAIVKMAKEIGIQTLAEGVETEEQFLFLKNIGCEKIQGYYFGRPMPLKETIPHFRKRGIRWENVQWTSYFDALGRINYLTEQPLCVIDDDGVRMRLLFCNKEYRDILKRDNVENIEEWVKRINTPGDPICNFHRQFADQQLRKLEGRQTIAYPSGDHYMQLTASVAAVKDEHYLYTVHIQYVKINTEEDFGVIKSVAINNLYYLCNDIALYDFNNGTVEGVKSSLSSQPMGMGTSRNNLESVIEQWTRDFCYAPDQKRFLEFADIRTLKQRLMESCPHILTGLFRSITASGEFQWFLHLIIPVQRTDFRQALHVTVEAGLDEAVIRETLNHFREIEIESDGSRNDITCEILWKNLMMNAKNMYFWKDDKRRFLGASKSFLQYFGLESEEEIIGKNDEELMWHIEPEVFKSIEEEVLRFGKKKYLVSGKCIVKGENRDIIASKIPVYRDGKIAGLLGNVVDARQAAEFFSVERDQSYTDQTTGLANFRGILETAFLYGGELDQGGSNLALLEVNVPEYQEAVSIYGEKLGAQMLKKISGTLKVAAGSHAVIGRVVGGSFCVMMNYASKSEVRNTGKEIRRHIENMGTVGRWKGTCSAFITAAYFNASDKADRSFTVDLGQLLLNSSDREVL